MVTLGDAAAEHDDDAMDYNAFVDASDEQAEGEEDDEYFDASDDDVGDKDVQEEGEDGDEGGNGSDGGCYSGSGGDGGGSQKAHQSFALPCAVRRGFGWFTVVAHHSVKRICLATLGTIRTPLTRLYSIYILFIPLTRLYSLFYKSASQSFLALTSRASFGPHYYNTSIARHRHRHRRTSRYHRSRRCARCRHRHACRRLEVGVA